MRHLQVALLLSCLSVFSGPFGFCLQEVQKLSPSSPDYTKEAFVVASTETRIQFAADGTYARTQTTSVRVQSEAGIQAWGVLAFGYAADNEHVDVHYVRVRKADGSTVITPATNVLELPSDVTRAAPMYSDLKQKQVPVKALGVGDTLEFEVAYVEDKPLIPGQFWFTYNFNRSSVVLNEVLKIRVPRDRSIKIADSGLEPETADDGSSRVYTWRHSNTAPTTPDGTGDEPDLLEKPSIQISTFTSWEQVGDWYSKLAQPQAKVTPEIQAKADALVKGIPPGSDQIQAIYDFVSSHIHYVGLSFGIGRYQPHTAAEVLENEYGDCKDKHTLLTALLKAEGVDAWPVLISSTEKLDDSVPSPGQFDHLITVVPQGKQYLWLDTTPEIAPYAMLLNNLRGKQALVVPPAAKASLVETPADPPFSAEDHLIMRGSLDNEGTFKGHAELTMRGDNEVIYRTIFHASPRAKWQDVLQAVSYRLGFGGEISNIQVDDPESTRRSFHLSWDYQRKKYGDWDNRQILPPTGGIPINVISEEKKPKSPIQVGSPGITIYTAELTLPPGSNLDAPPNTDVKTTFAEYHAKYSVADGKYLAERRLTILKKKLPVADWQSYLSFQKELNTDYSRMSSVTAPGAETLAGNRDDNPEAADLIRKAALSFQQDEQNLAQDQLDKAKKLNPHQTNLNAMYGSLYMMRGKTEDGIDAYQLELKEHPDNLRVARWFAEMLDRMKREDDAIKVYRTVLKSVPDDVDANSGLAHLLVTNENWKEAQPVLEKTIKLRPDNAQIQIWYGQSCLRNGKEAEGLAALKNAADAAVDPAELASVADALADSGKALDIALKAAQRAVTMVEQKTGDLTLQEITTAQLKEMTELTESWDALGWTASKSGDMALAEKYEMAAWRLSQDPKAGDHLAQIYEKQGKLRQALDTYMLAKARAYPVVAGIDDRISALEKRLEHPSSIGGDGASRLQDLRIIHLARTKPVSASADFLVLFAGSTVSDVKMLGGDTTLGNYTDVLKQTNFDFSFPDSGPEHVVRQGILSCSVYDAKCMFFMMLPADASTNSRAGVSMRQGEIRQGETKTVKLKP